MTDLWQAPNCFVWFFFLSISFFSKFVIPVSFKRKLNLHVSGSFEITATPQNLVL